MPNNETIADGDIASRRELTDETLLEEWLTCFDEAIRHGAAPPLPHAGVSREEASGAAVCLSLLESMWPRSLADFQPAPDDHPKSIGKFHLLQRLGEGGFGVVFRARDTTIQRDVALKVPKPSRVLDQNALKRFEREARVLARCNHPAIVPVLEAGIEDGVHYIASRLCEGPSLDQWLKEQRNGIAPRVAATLIKCLAEGLAHAHRDQIIHRDLKPSNILLDGILRDGENQPTIPALRITDFGLACQLDGTASTTTTGKLFGSVDYMSPEQSKGGHVLDTRSDLYSLGVILYEMLVGRLPHTRGSVMATLRATQEEPALAPRKIRPELPRDLETICLKCLEKQPQDRYVTATELCNDLDAYLAGKPIAAKPTSVITRFGKWTKRQPVLAGLSAAFISLMLAVVCLISSFVWKLSDANRALIKESKRSRQAENRAEQILKDSLAVQIQMASTSSELDAVDQAYRAHERLSFLSGRDRPSNTFDEADYHLINASAKASLQSVAIDPPSVETVSETLVSDPASMASVSTDPDGNWLAYAFPCEQGFGLRVTSLNRTREGSSFNKRRIVLAAKFENVPTSTQISQGGMLISTAEVLRPSKNSDTANATTRLTLFRQNKDGNYSNLDSTVLDRVSQQTLDRNGKWVCVWAENRVELRGIDSVAGFATESSRSTAFPANVNAVAFDDSGTRLAVAFGNHVRIIDVSSGRRIQQLDHQFPPMVCSVAFSRDGQFLVSGREDFRTYVWNLRCDDAPAYVFDGLQEWVTNVSFLSPTQILSAGASSCCLHSLEQTNPTASTRRTVICTFDQGMISLNHRTLEQFRLRASETRHVFHSPEISPEVYHVATSSNSSLAVSAGHEHLAVWDLENQSLVHSVPCESVRAVFCLDHPRDAATDAIAAATHDGLFRYSLDESRGDRSTRRTPLFQHHDFQNDAIAYSAPHGHFYRMDPWGTLFGKSAWADPDDEEKRFLEIEASSKFESKTNHERLSGLLDVSPDGNHLLMVDRNRRQMHVIDLKTESVIDTRTIEAEPKHAAISRDGSLVALGFPQHVSLLEVGPDAPSSPHVTHIDKQTVWAGFDLNDRLLLATLQGEIEVFAPSHSANQPHFGQFSIEEQRNLRFDNHGRPRAAALTADGTRLLTTGRNLVLQMWDLDRMNAIIHR